MLELLTTVVTRINRVFLGIAAAVIVILALFMTVVVVRRYVFSAPLGWALDVARSLFAYSVFFALAPTLQNRNHVSVDLVHERLPPALKHWTTTIAWLMVVAFSLLLFWKVWELTATSFETGRRFPGSWQVPAKYIHVAAPIGTGQLFLTAIVGTLRHVTRREYVPASRVVTSPETPISQHDAETRWRSLPHGHRTARTRGVPWDLNPS
jgi:TRAP-type C4-dicarboxylate transport system permease small subunit